MSTSTSQASSGEDRLELEDLSRTLVDLARVHLPESLRQGLIGRLEATEDWETLFEAATWHGVDTLLHVHLQELGVVPPAPMAERLRNRYLATARRNLYLTVELKRVMQALDARGIRAMAFKGPVAAEAYGNPALRSFGDVDVVVHPTDLRAAIDVLTDMTYEPWADDLEAMLRDPAQYGAPFGRTEGDVCVDLHWGFAWGWFGRTLAFDDLWSRSEVLILAGQDVRVFSDEDQLLHMAMHGSKHGPVPWAKLKWIADMVELIGSRPPGTFDGLPSRARRIGAGGILALSLALVRDLHGTALPEALDAQIEAHPRALDQVDWVARGLFTHGSGDTDLGPEVKFNLALRERRTDRWLYSWRRITTPRPRDREALDLPPSLHFLYPGVRLVRLGCRYVNPRRIAEVFRRS